MAALTNLKAGSTVVYQDDYYTHVWYGGTIVSILYTETGDECDCWTYGDRPTSVTEAMQRARSRAADLAEDDSPEQDAL